MAVQEVKWNNVTKCRDLEARRDKERFRERKMPSVFGGGGRKTWIINPLKKTKCRPLYLEAQFVPRFKHFSTRL
jgi:hypothetical protein